jgi:hypothetical protein
MRYFFAFILITTSAFSQPIQEFKVRSFAGGMVNSLSNALMQDDQQLVLENYDIVNGKLKRRAGYTIYKTDTSAAMQVYGLFPYQALTDKDFLILRNIKTFYPDDTADKFVGVLTRCNEADGKCTTLVAHGFLTDRRNQNVPYSMNFNTINNRLVLAVAKSEMQLYDGNKAFPARPRMAGQPKVLPLDGTGKINGVVSYRFLFVDSSAGAAKYSNLSPPSWAVEVKDGKLFILDLGPVVSTTLQDSLVIYRSLNGGTYQRLTAIHLPDVVPYYQTFVDSAATTNPGDTTPYKWGYSTNCVEAACVEGLIPAPGAILVNGNNAAASNNGPTFQMKGLTDTTCLSFAYSVVFRDSSGRESYASPPDCATYTAALIRAAGEFAPALTKIPIPRDSGIVDKILLRGLVGNVAWSSQTIDKISYIYPINNHIDNAALYSVTIDGIAVKWYSPSAGTTAAMIVDSMVSYINAATVVKDIVRAIDQSTYIELNSAKPGIGWVLTGNVRLTPDVLGFSYTGERLIRQAFQVSDYIYNFVPIDTLDDTTTTYTDSIPYDSLDIIEPWCEDSVSAQQPTSFCYDDSNITFQPFDITSHGDRLFAIGDINDRNALWYSDFGRPTTMPPDHFILVETQSGDWFVRLLSVGDNLLLFRQHSIYGLSGLSFFQFNLEKLVSGVGVSAPRTLTANKNIINFLHESGAYEMSTSGGLSSPPISWVIKNSLDSIGTNLRRSVGKAVGDEWWLSAPIASTANNQTYIYSRTPTPHWKSYSFGINDIVLYDKDTLALDYATDRFIFASGTDSLFQWRTDSLVTTDNGTLIQAKYQSKYFFHEGEGPIRREKIFYVDFFGKYFSGALDTLMVTFYEESKGAVDSVKFVPNFSNRKVNRVTFNRISDNCSIGWRSYGLAIYEITGITIGWNSWDEGKKQ